MKSGTALEAGLRAPGPVHVAGEARPARLRPARTLTRAEIEALEGAARVCLRPADALAEAEAALAAFTGRTARLRCGALVPTPAPFAPRAGRIELSTGESGRVVLEIDAPTWHALVDLALGGEGAPVGLEPPTELEQGVLAVLAGELLRRLGTTLSPALPRLGLHDVGTGVPAATFAVALPIELDVGPVTGSARLLLTREAVGETGRAEPRALPARALRAPPVELRVEVARTRLEPQDVTQLRPGDVLLLDEVLLRADHGVPGRVRVRAGQGRAALQGVARRLEGVWHIELSGMDPDHRGHAMDDTGRSGAGVDGTALLRDVPLEIVAELGRVTLSADEVMRLQPGSVLELRVGPGEPLELSIHGRVVARGELVEVEGQLGVRILGLADA